jgi:hypothetical protein
MTTKTAGVLGAVTLLAGASAAHAAPAVDAGLAEVMNVTSYAELLQPIPNAMALLRASDAQAQATPLPLATEGDGTVVEAQFYHHHHHHHGRFHHHGYFRGGPFFHHHHHGFYRRFYHHHHHHHFRRDYY